MYEELKENLNRIESELNKKLDAVGSNNPIVHQRLRGKISGIRMAKEEIRRLEMYEGE